IDQFGTHVEQNSGSQCSYVQRCPFYKRAAEHRLDCFFCAELIVPSLHYLKFRNSGSSKLRHRLFNGLNDGPVTFIMGIYDSDMFGAMTSKFHDQILNQHDERVAIKADRAGSITSVRCMKMRFVAV